MAVHRLAEMTFEELAGLGPDRMIAILPVGATEAHGPHLPLMTDVVIAEGMARQGAILLAENGFDAILLPPVAYSVARYASGFCGTISLTAETASQVLVEIGQSLRQHGMKTLVLANAHLEPAHIGSLRDAAERIQIELGVTVVFPDVTRKPWALRLTDEFKSGACHAGRYEGSIVMAERPELVRDEIRRGLADNWNSLATAIREGKDTFEEAGGPRAYFGEPARASADEGKRTLSVLGAILCEATLAALPDAG